MALNSGQLILIPTSLNEDLAFDENVVKIIKDALDQESFFLVESHKIARRRWLGSKLPREEIEQFIVFNRKTEDELTADAVKRLLKGQIGCLISDSGMPAFCDPGVELVKACHRNGILVRSAPIANSVIQAICLSGFEMNQYYFAGFPPQKSEDRIKFLTGVLSKQEAAVLMDTPYRLTKLLQEIKEIESTRELFLAIDLNLATEQYFIGTASAILNQIQSSRAEFILISSPKS